MKFAKLAIGVALLGAVLTAPAFAQVGATDGLRQPASVRLTAFESADDYAYLAPANGQNTEPSPSDRPAPKPMVEPAADLGAGCGCGTVAPSVCDPCTTCCGSDEPYRLFDFTALRCRGIEIGGWLDQGITTNADDPANRFNGPVTFNDRSNEYQLNQAYLYMQREADTGGCGWDIGGRVDLLYGTDHRFATANGLEDKWNGGQRFYGLAMPQAYVDVAYNDLTIRMGHYYTIIGNEVVTAPDNFFYSHAYTMQYAEPFTHTGMLAMYDLNDCWSFSGGFDRGWDQWEDNNDELSFLGGLKWTSWDERTSLAMSMTLGKEDDAGENTRRLYSFVFTRQLTDRLQYVFQTDLGNEDNAGWQAGEDAEWYGFVNYFLYELNPCWSAGLRYEWFSDDDGARVAGLGNPSGIPLNAVPSQWQEVSLGLNYKPNANVTVRSEVRWDWADPLINTNDGPFDDFTGRSQFLWGTDLIVRF